jgi:hypothetical protein
MRACNGCRKRKIKCDAATTNTWPCSACTRLKLVCVPPAIGQDGDTFYPGQDGTDVNGYLDVSTSQGSLPHPLSGPPDLISEPPAVITHFSSFGNGTNIYSSYIQPPHNPSALYDDNRAVLYNETTAPHISVTHPYPQVFPHTADPSLISTNDSPIGVEQDLPSTAEDLSEALGELKIDESGIGMTPTGQPPFLHLLF